MKSHDTIGARWAAVAAVTVLFFLAAALAVLGVRRDGTSAAAARLSSVAHRPVSEPAKPAPAR